jgi:hypothetical protein
MTDGGPEGESPQDQSLKLSMENVTDNKLFVPAKDETGAYVRHAECDLHAVAFGYREGARALRAGLEASHPYWDYAAFPLVFMYHHHLELMLKLVISLMYDIVEPGKHPPQTHDLNALFAIMEQMAKQLESTSTSDSARSFLEHVGQQLHELNEFTQQGEAMRYVSRSIKRSHPKEIHLCMQSFDIDTFVARVETLCNSIEAMHSFVSDLRDAHFESMFNEPQGEHG